MRAEQFQREFMRGLRFAFERRRHVNFADFLLQFGKIKRILMVEPNLSIIKGSCEFSIPDERSMKRGVAQVIKSANNVKINPALGKGECTNTPDDVLKAFSRDLVKMFKHAHHMALYHDERNSEYRDMTVE